MKNEVTKNISTNGDLDFSEMLKAAPIVKSTKQKEKKPPMSMKPLKFDILEGDSSLKRTIVEVINKRNLTYSDLYQYCTKLKDGDVEAGSKAAQNYINGLRTRHTMIDTTFSVLCDFLELDIYLKPRKNEVPNGDEETT